MPHAPHTPTTPANPFGTSGQAPADRRDFPTWNPFEGPPELELTLPEATEEAIRRAYGEWREYLPHGLSLSDYGCYRNGWLRELAISSAMKPLIPVLPTDKVTDAARSAADIAFDCVANLLSHYEPD